MDRESRRSAGFSLVELIVVLGIMGVIATIALPRLMAYMRLYKIKGAASAVMGEIQAARNKAITKNVNRGVTFFIDSPTTYQYVIEDDLEPPFTAERVPLATLVAGRNTTYKHRFGPLRALPQGIRFGTSCTGFGTATDSGFRFNRMGQWCDPTVGSATCGDLGVGQNLVMNSSAGTEPGGAVCVEQANNQSLKMMVRVGTGGRTRIQQ